METKSKTTSIPKIAVKIHPKILSAFKREMETSCLRRDAYLSRLLESELNWLDDEVEVSNSMASYEYVVGELNKQPLVTVSLALPKELIAKLNKICSDKNIVRDAFFNRLLLILSASHKLISELFFDANMNWQDSIDDSRIGRSVFDNFDKPLEPELDPFWAIRAGLNTATIGNSVYTKIFEIKKKKEMPKQVMYLSCYAPDESIPNPTANLKAIKNAEVSLADMLGAN